MSITITMTAGEILDAGLWEKFCELTGTSLWAMNEGQIEGDHQFELPPEMTKDEITV
jgi:hypothetical protein